MARNRLKTELFLEAGVAGLDQIDATIKRLRETGINVDHLSDALDELRGEWGELAPTDQTTKLRKLSVEIGNAEKESRALSKATNQTAQSFGRLKTIAVSLAAVLGVTFVTRKVTQFFGSAVSGAANLEEQLARVKAVSGATADEMTKITAKAKQLGSTTRYTATQAAQGFEILARAGLNAEQQIAAIQPVLALAQGQSIEMAEAAQYITDAVVIMGGSFEEAGRYTDVLAKGASQAATTVPELAKAISYTGQYAKETGMSIEELVAVLDLMANNGVRGERAGTALRNIFAQMQDPASKAAQALRALDIDTASLISVIEGLQGAGARGREAINAFGTEAGPALRALLAGGVQAIGEFNEELNNATDTAQNAADGMDNTFAGAIKGIQSAWQALKTALGTPILEPATNKLREFADVIREMTSSGKITELGKQIADLFERGADKALAFVKSINFSATIDKITGAVGRVGDAASRLSGIFTALTVTFKAVRLGFYSIGMAASAVFTTIAAYFEILTRIPAKIAGIFGDNSISQFFIDINDGLKTLTDDLAQNTRELAGEVQASFGSINDTLTGTAQAVRAVSAEISSAQQELNANLSTLGVTATSTAEEIIAAYARIIASTTDTEGFYAIRQELQGLLNTGRLVTEQYDKLIQNVTKQESITEPLRMARDAMQQQLLEVGITAQSSVEQVNAAVLEMLNTIEDPTALKALKELLYEAGNMGKLQAELSTQLYLKTSQAAMDAYQAKLQEAQANRDIQAEIQKTIELQDKAAQSAREAFERIGVDMEGINTGIASSNRQMIRDLVTGLEQAQAAGQDTAKLVGAAFDQMLKKLNTKEEFAAFNDALKSTGTRAQLSTKQLAALNEGLRESGDAARDAAQSTGDYGDSLLATIRKARAARAEAAKSRRATKEQTDALKEKSKATDDDKDKTEVWSFTTTNAYNAATDAVRETGKAAQDSARDMANLASSAKDTADQIAASLAGIRGDTEAQAKLQQDQKLRELRAKLAEAQARGNGEEIQQYQRAINLQRQLYAEQQEQAKAQAAEKVNATSSDKVTDSKTESPPSNTKAEVDKIAGAWDARIAEAERRGAERAKRELLNELHSAAKRKAV